MAGDLSRVNPLDHRVHAAVAERYFSISPTSVTLAITDWWMQLAISPGKCLELAQRAIDQGLRLQCYVRDIMRNPDAQRPSECVIPPSFDKRFASDDWHKWPFNIYHQAFLLTDELWHHATTGVAGVDQHHEDIVRFIARQTLDVISPGNFIATNPLVLRRCFETGGWNLLQGSLNLLEDYERQLTRQPSTLSQAFRPGKDVAITPGKIVVRNRVMELIQYAPGSDTVRPEPILIVPAWIMKYYILDLSPQNSLVRFLVDQGFTVFCISWKNPSWSERDLDIEDYLQSGFFTALDAIGQVRPGIPVHSVGYCLGGTLLAIAAAAMARDHDQRLKTISLFTTQVDFRESGELALFIDEAEVSLLEAQMHDTGYLTAGQMAGAFQMLRSNDLMWSRLINEYLMGQRTPPTDLMAWNADSTRMPARMHGRYLRELFLNNSLSESRYSVRGEPVTLFNIQTPLFSVATQADHVAPWTSVYKIHYLTPAEITFVLTSGGHNAGIINSPGRKDRSFQVLTRPYAGHYISPQRWQQQAPRFAGSWWDTWSTWLAEHSGAPIPPPRWACTSPGQPPLTDAPGLYVHEK